jgi:hypothetical protein
MSAPFLPAVVSAIVQNCASNDHHQRAAASAAQIQNNADPQLRWMKWLASPHFLFKVVT